MKSTPRVRWDDEGAWIKLADLPYEASEEIADGFIVDASPDHRVIGLEILWSESQRAGYPEEPVLAFGLFCAALAGLSWQYNDYLRNSARHPEVGMYRRLKWMIDATNLDLRVSQETPAGADDGASLLDLAILDKSDRPLICAEIKRGKFQRDIVHDYTALLSRTTLPSYPEAIGIGVFIDETGQGYRNRPVEPGVWTDWHNTDVQGSKVWAHNTILPPLGSNYPWLPKELRDPMFKAQI